MQFVWTKGVMGPLAAVPWSGLLEMENRLVSPTCQRFFFSSVFLTNDDDAAAAAPLSSR
jgi:hypothetical protein